MAEAGLCGCSDTPYTFRGNLSAEWYLIRNFKAMLGPGERPWAL